VRRTGGRLARRYGTFDVNAQKRLRLALTTWIRKCALGRQRVAPELSVTIAGILEIHDHLLADDVQHLTDAILDCGGDLKI
jgi:hypothetical protein